jgi:N-carbamoylputrescine amidase
VVLGPGGEQMGVYRKMHIPDDPAYYEKFYFTPGDGRPLVVQTPFGRVGTLVCWDQWFPEAARLAALQGAEVLFYPTAIGWHPAEKDQVGATQRDAWQTVQRSHAIASGMYVAAVNRTGHETPAGGDGIEFWGSTFLAGPFGQVVAEAPVDQPQVLVSDVDTGDIEQTRRGWPFLRDRRIDAYHPLLKRWDDKTDT